MKHPPRSTPTRVLAAVLALLVLVGCAGQSSLRPDDGGSAGYVSGDGSIARWRPAERTEPVELTGTAYDGAEVDLAELRGDVVVLNTWYAACPPCRVEAPDLVAVAHDYADRGVHLVGINTRDDAGAAQAYERTFEVPYPSIDDRSGAAVAALQGAVPVQAVPTTVVLDREGRVAARVLGLVEGSTLRALVDEVLEEPAA